MIADAVVMIANAVLIWAIRDQITAYDCVRRVFADNYWRFLYSITGWYFIDKGWMDMSEQCFNVEEFRSVYRAGGFSKVGLEATAGKMAIWGETRNKMRVSLVSTRLRDRRHFATPEKALRVLVDMGVKTAEIDLRGWNPNKHKKCLRRPDVAARMLGIHRAGKLQEEMGGPVSGKAYWGIDRVAPGPVMPMTLSKGRFVLYRDGRLDPTQTQALQEADREAKRFDQDWELRQKR